MKIKRRGAENAEANMNRKANLKFLTLAVMPAAERRTPVAHDEVVGLSDQQIAKPR
jgi:hypothetical protein